MSNLFPSDKFYSKKKLLTMDVFKKILNDEDYLFMEFIQIVLGFLRISQMELADELGVSKTTVLNWMTGRIEPSEQVKDSVRDEVWRIARPYMGGVPVEIWCRCK